MTKEGRTLGGVEPGELFHCPSGRQGTMSEERLGLKDYAPPLKRRVRSLVIFGAGSSGQLGRVSVCLLRPVAFGRGRVMDGRPGRRRMKGQAVTDDEIGSRLTGRHSNPFADRLTFVRPCQSPSDGQRNEIDKGLIWLPQCE